MTLPRCSIARLMGLVALVALNIAAFREAIAYCRNLAIEGAPFVLALEFGACRLVYGRGRPRLFWAGFLAAGLLAIVVSLPPFNRPPQGYLQSTGPTSYLFIEQKPASPVWNLWFEYSYRYVPWATAPLKPWLGALDDREDFTAFVVSLPLLSIALVGGLLGRFIPWPSRLPRFRPAHELT